TIHAENGKDIPYAVGDRDHRGEASRLGLGDGICEDLLHLGDAQRCGSRRRIEPAGGRRGGRRRGTRRRGTAAAAAASERGEEKRAKRGKSGRAKGGRARGHERHRRAWIARTARPSAAWKSLGL